MHKERANLRLALKATGEECDRWRWQAIGFRRKHEALCLSYSRLQLLAGRETSVAANQWDIAGSRPDGVELRP